MDDLLAALASSIPTLVATHGPTFVLLMISLLANAVQYRDNKSLNKQINEEIKAGIMTANGFKDAFVIAAEAMKDVRRSR